MKTIYLAGGCFWGTEHYLRQFDGVLDTVTGYANGNIPNPSYEQVYTDQTGYAMDCGPPGPTVHGILQANILEWVVYYMKCQAR